MAVDRYARTTAEEAIRIAKLVLGEEDAEVVETASEETEEEG